MYGFDEIKAQLTAENGYQFSSTCDSEIVVALYQTYGLGGMLEHLRGEFAFCLYDEEKKLFVAARDRYGIKPLFYTVQSGQLLVAAEAKAFLPLGWEPEWDVRSMVEGGWNFDDRTLFKDVKKVRPGCYVTCDVEGRVEHRRYWDLEYPDKVGNRFFRDLRKALLTEAGRLCETLGQKKRSFKVFESDSLKQYGYVSELMSPSACTLAAASTHLSLLA